MTAEHVTGLNALLASTGVNANAAEFRRYGSARKLYNFNVDHADDNWRENAQAFGDVS